MSRIMTLTECKANDEAMIKNTIIELNKKILELKVDEFKDKRYIEALESQVKTMNEQLKKFKVEAQPINFTSILKDVNDNIAKDRGLTKQQINDIDEDIKKRLSKLMI